MFIWDEYPQFFRSARRGTR